MITAKATFENLDTGESWTRTYESESIILVGLQLKQWHTEVQQAQTTGKPVAARLDVHVPCPQHLITRGEEGRG